MSDAPPSQGQGMFQPTFNHTGTIPGSGPQGAMRPFIPVGVPPGGPKPGIPPYMGQQPPQGIRPGIPPPGPGNPPQAQHGFRGPPPIPNIASMPPIGGMPPPRPGMMGPPNVSGAPSMPPPPPSGIGNMPPSSGMNMSNMPPASGMSNMPSGPPVNQMSIPPPHVSGGQRPGPPPPMGGQFRGPPPLNISSSASGPPPMSNGLQSSAGARQPTPPTSNMPSIGPYASRGVNQGPPTSSAPAPKISVTPGVSVQNNMNYTQTNPQERPEELPVPYHGQASYSHQLHLHAQATTPTPGSGGSDPQSQKSSRAPSPVSNQQYEMLEGQFNSSKPGTPQPGFRSTPPLQKSPLAGSSPRDLHAKRSQPHGISKAPSGPGQQPPPLGSFPGPLPSALPGPPQSTASQFPGQERFPSSTGPGQRPGLYQPGQYPQAPSSLAGQQQQFPPPSSLPSQQHPPSSYSGQMGQPTSTGPTPSGAGQGITGKRVYPQMPQQTAYNQPPPPGTQTGPASGTLNDVMQQPGIQPQYNQPGMQPQFNQPGMQPQFNQPGMQPQFNQPGMQPQYSQPGMQAPEPMAPTANSAYANSTSTGFNSNFGRMNVMGDVISLNLLQEKILIPPDGVETPKPNLPHDFKKVNCNPDVFRCTLNAIPQSQSLLSKARLPLGVLIHPFKDLSSLPVIQSSVIVRCRSCRTYINPFVTFVDQRRWRCNLCYRVNEMPDEFTYDPVSKTYGAPERRPEIRSATVEFIAPSEYMLRPPQPAVYLFILDTSFSAIETGYLQSFCTALLDELDRLPGDARTKVAFITYDSSIKFYNLSEGLSQPQMLVVSDIEDVFIPSPDGLICNLSESKDLIIELLNELPTMFKENKETNSALGAALAAAMKLLTPTGGRCTVLQGCLPNIGPGAVKARENPNERAGKNVSHLGPATDFYKKLALDCSAQQIAIDMFFLTGQYVDIATLGCAAKYSGGSLHHYPGAHNVQNPAEMERFENDLRRYLTRKVGFESVMRIRATKGLSIHTFHGNFFVRSTDLLSLPNINPDAGFGMQVSIEDTLTESQNVCFQAALLYTSSRGERRIRVHTLCLPVTNQISEIQASADQQAIIGLLTKMAVDKSLSGSLGDAREAMINACIDALGAFGATLSASQKIGALMAPHTIRLLPLYIMAMLKHTAFRVGSSTKLDDRVFAMEQCKTLPLQYLMLKIYPDLYPIHALDDKNAISRGDTLVPQPPLLDLSSAYLDRHGAYLLDVSDHLYMWIGGAVSDRFCQEVFDVPNFMSLQDGMCDLPDLENPTSERLRNFVSNLQDTRPHHATLLVIRDDSRNRMQFLQYMVEDRTESAMSYYEFLQHIQKQIKT